MIIDNLLSPNRPKNCKTYIYIHYADLDANFLKGVSIENPIIIINSNLIGDEKLNFIEKINSYQKKFLIIDQDDWYQKNL